ncbi:MAG TPA: DNA alkylation repair protein [Burkholderiaceae bacterium]|nr:DNA alkylation repair protein [Burkholderiaceae bacterium]
MTALLKDRYDRAYVRTLADALAAAAHGFDHAGFVRAVLGRRWRTLELKQRMRRIAQTLHAFLPGDYRAQLRVLLRVAPQFGGFEAMFFPDFVECFGLDDFDASVAALEVFTQYSSSEFAVRPFLLRYGPRMLAAMERWARHPNEHVRRLASEGTRPRLPWAMALPEFKADPRPCLPILETLRNDPSEMVRRSVANHLNDIAKEHPDIVLDVAARWLGQTPATDALVRHACRTLTRRGDQRALRFFGHHDAVDVSVDQLRLSPRRLPIGSDLTFSFTVALSAGLPVAARIDYAVDFVKANGRISRKVFRIGERSLTTTPLAIRRKHRFCDFTTRKHFPGVHRIAIVVNGVERAAGSFQLVAARR